MTLSRFPGSCHDSFIEKNSELHVEYEILKNLPVPNALVLGDSAYCRSYDWLCTPFLEGTIGDDPDKAFFNKVICGCRSIIEDTFGQIQGKFPCLGEKNGIKFPSVKKCALYIEALFALWNFIKRNDDEDCNIWIDNQDSSGPLPNLDNDVVELEPGKKPTNEILFEKFFKKRRI